MSCCNACGQKDTEIVVSNTIEEEEPEEIPETPYEAEKKREKPRLRSLLKGFAREMVEGVHLNVITGAAGVALPMQVNMNVQLNVMTFLPHDPNLVEFAVDFSDVSSVYKGKVEVAKLYPELDEEISEMCVGLEVVGEPDPILFHFPCSLDYDDPARFFQRNKFFTCVYLLWHAHQKTRENEAELAAAAAQNEEQYEQDYEQEYEQQEIDYYANQEEVEVY
eukprot:Platyproteum_vivax@DN6384_c0_g1_i2.p1